MVCELFLYIYTIWLAATSSTHVLYFSTGSICSVLNTCVWNRIQFTTEYIRTENSTQIPFVLLNENVK